MWDWQPEEQVFWIETLASSKPSALLIAARSDAPGPSKAMLDAADRLNFSVIFASFELEFIKLSLDISSKAC